MYNIDRKTLDTLKTLDLHLHFCCQSINKLQNDILNNYIKAQTLTIINDSSMSKGNVQKLFWTDYNH